LHRIENWFLIGLQSEKYRTLFLRRDTMFRDLLIRRKTTLKSFEKSLLWVANLPFAPAFKGFFTQFL
jgi:hypothetical protein